MVQEALVYHSVMIKLFLVLLAINLWVPWIFKSNIMKEVKATRITFFFYSSMVTMVAFTGAVLVLIAEIPWSLGISLMVVSWVFLSIVEIVRSVKLTRLWREGKSAVSMSWRYVMVEIAITVMMILFSTLDHKDAVPLP
ncbi:MAG: hypothetical protein U9R26_00100 [Campylobacterota bacterium]|nr:hypothetical protein [Campylobacterota bacterium]